jgi:hypothetical protein
LVPPFQLFLILILKQEIQYRFSYVEEVVGSTTSSWAIRQTGVYHRYVPHGPGSLWVFLHPRPNSTLQTRLENCALEWDRKKGSDDDWELAHILIDTDNLKAAIAVSLDFEKDEHYRRGTDTLQNLHSLQDKILPLCPRLRSTLATVISLETFFETLRRKSLYEELHSIKILDELRAYEVFINGHISSVELLEKRVQEILSLVSYI